MTPETQAIVQEADVVPTRPSMLVTGTALLVTALSLAAAGLFWRCTSSDPTARTTPAFTDRGAEGRRVLDADRERLEHYEWVDRDRGLVRIPIERAMDLVVQEQAP